MVDPRRSLNRAFSLAGVFGLVAILHEFGVKYAEQMGWYDNLPSRLEAAMTWLATLAEPLWFKALTALIVGIAIGMWIDGVLRQNERAVRQISRDQLARDAEAIGRRISLLAGQGAARQQIAWNEDVLEMRSTPSEPNMIPRRDRSADARAWTLERYGELHYEATSIIAQAARCISLDRSDLWQISHVLTTGHDIDKMANFLANIATQLRYDQPAMPTVDTRSAKHLAQSNLTNPKSMSQE